MQHIIPESHLELLQAIFIELVKARDEEAVFKYSSEVSEPEDES